MWELKGVSSKTSTDNQVRTALKQIASNPGGVILDYGNNMLPLETARETIGKRIARSRKGIKTVDIIIRAYKNLQIILRF